MKQIQRKMESKTKEMKGQKPQKEEKNAKILGTVANE